MTQGPENVYSGPASGTYEYNIQQNGDSETLILENTTQGFLILSNQTLIVNDSSDDGLTRLFER